MILTILIPQNDAVHGAFDTAGVPLQGRRGRHGVEVPEEVQCEAGEAREPAGVDGLDPGGKPGSGAATGYLTEVADVFGGRIRFGTAGQDLFRISAFVLAQTLGVAGEPAGDLPHRRWPGWDGVAVSSQRGGAGVVARPGARHGLRRSACVSWPGVSVRGASVSFVEAWDDLRCRGVREGWATRLRIPFARWSVRDVVRVRSAECRSLPAEGRMVDLTRQGFLPEYPDHLRRAGSGPVRSSGSRRCAVFSVSTLLAGVGPALRRPTYPTDRLPRRDEGGGESLPVAGPAPSPAPGGRRGAGGAQDRSCGPGAREPQPRNPLGAPSRRRTRTVCGTVPVPGCAADGAGPCVDDAVPRPVCRCRR
ncbi:hypothetical protein EHYA_06877 [Embleya hyalina]|uniref:Uncharacterized protein n=1 Tax=Embleya hyalina TaxID=516124 RepID=A0A401YX27_9ACTN|nr:hypothetical protein EHYA_06877 [Embleya hyalina]